MKYKQIKPKKIYEEVADTLLESIRSGDLKPGEKLDSVQRLAESFQVGRSAIREALTSLRAMGLIEMRQGEGTYVKSFEAAGIAFPLQSALLMNSDDLKSLMEVRKILETGIAASAAERRTLDDLNAMQLAVRDMVKYSADPELGEKADLAFHLAIAEAAGNSLLSSLMHHVSDMTAESMRETRRLCLYEETATVDQLNVQHEAILQAIESRDAKQARKAMNTHLDYVEIVLRNYMDTH
ncbi:FadR/GntR family transcriptional regulator [Domibacillus iocasae]|uniref:GntR family transcriptional regulator n=1 Tax=Domibacillus iocasae TaxID=1714016 RepID=A0A1E7DU06_9BACI|nr:FadR/GntR family transcriptional regulator [Domibacillus iocasae]OES46563.1 GntR family transcriptional regulator [Domibacillus iocasae]